MIDLEVSSTGLGFHVDLTDTLAEKLRGMGAKDGLVPVFAHGSTVGLTIMRYEPGAVADLLAALGHVAPDDRNYLHGLTTGDPNGFSHVRSSILGTSLVLPWRAGEMAMSAAHRVVLFDFDLVPSTRRVFVDPREGTHVS